jgi:transcriptional regulator with XRE-family HTH domain
MRLWVWRGILRAIPVKTLFGSKLLQARKAKGLTQRDFARLLGVSPPFVCLVEKGLRIPKIDMLQRMATALNVEPSSLLP